MVKKRPKWVAENMRDGDDEDSAELFPGIRFPMGLVFRHREKGWIIKALHGHQADLLNDDLWMLARLLVRYLWKPLRLSGIKNPVSAAHNPKLKKMIVHELTTWAAKENVMVVAGHTHMAEFPVPGEPMYFNDGCCVRKEIITAIEIENDMISLIKWGIESNDDGVLRVERSVMEGPVPLEAYFEAAGDDAE
jgi:hypothetical protein